MPVDWLPFSLPMKFRVGDPSKLMSKAVEVEISRSPNYQLTVSAEGSSDFHAEKIDQKATPQAVDLDLLGKPFNPSRLEGYLPLRHTISSHYTDAPVVKETGRAKALHVQYNSKSTPAFITEWLTNVPNNRIWPRTTDRERNITEWIMRDSIKVAEMEEKTSGLSRDHMRVDFNLPHISFLRFGKVQTDGIKETINTERAGFLEFHPGPEGMPDETMRRAVRRALEFLFGCGFAVLGETIFNEEGLPVIASAKSSFVPGGEQSPMPPALLHKEWRDGVDEELASKYIANFINYDSFERFNRFVWLWLYSFNAPLDMSAGYLGVSLEILRDAYYSRPENEPRSKLLPKSEWRAVLKTLQESLDNMTDIKNVDSISSKLNEIKSRLGDLNKVSAKKLNILLLNDLNLDYGDVETKALQARNDSVHGSIFGSNDYREVLQQTRSLQTLVSRVFLRMLGMDEFYYFDYGDRDPATSDPKAKPLKMKQGLTHFI